MKYCKKHERKYKYCLIEDYKEKDKIYKRKDENQVIKNKKWNEKFNKELNLIKSWMKTVNQIIYSKYCSK